MEHTRWWDERRADGWSWGQEKDEQLKKNPSMLLRHGAHGSGSAHTGGGGLLWEVPPDLAAEEGRREPGGPAPCSSAIKGED